MGFLGFGKRRDVVDLSKRYEKQQEKLSQTQPENQEQKSDSPNVFSLFDAGASSSATSPASDNSDYIDVSSGVDEKKKKLIKRLMDMTAKIEELTNQIYHLQQRIEVLERKSGIGGFG